MIEIDDMQDEYLTYVEEQLERIDDILSEINDCETPPQEHLRKLNMVVHSIKGTAGSFGFKLGSKICHNFEDSIALLIENKDFKDANIMTSYADLLQSYFQSIRTYDEEAHTKIEETLREMTSPKESESHHKRILLVEPSRSLSSTITKVLTRKNHVVALAKDGYEALGRCLHEDFDVLVVAKNIPAIDGTELITCLNSLNKTEQTQRILITADNSPSPSANGFDKTFSKDSKLFANLLSNLEKNKEPLKESPKSKSEPAKSLRRVLCVDDDSMIQKLVKVAFKTHKNTELSFFDSTKGVMEAIKETNPDVILIDYMIGDENGFEFFEEIEAAQVFREKTIPVIFLSGIINDKKIVQEIRDANCLGLISKPFNPGNLARDVVNLWLASEGKEH